MIKLPFGWRAVMVVTLSAVITPWLFVLNELRRQMWFEMQGHTIIAGNHQYDFIYEMLTNPWLWGFGIALGLVVNFVWMVVRRRRDRIHSIRIG